MNAKEIAAKRLVTGARTERELIDFLCKKGVDRAEAEQVAKEFKEDGYIDDLRFSKDFIVYGEGKGWGRGRISQELSKKGVDSETVRKAYEEREEELEAAFGEAGGSGETGGRLTEEDRALQVIEKMMRGYEPRLEGTDDEPFRLDEKTRSRIARRLFSYGYKTSDIYGAIKRFENNWS